MIIYEIELSNYPLKTLDLTAFKSLQYNLRQNEYKIVPFGCFCSSSQFVGLSGFLCRYTKVLFGQLVHTTLFAIMFFPSLQQAFRHQQRIRCTSAPPTLHCKSQGMGNQNQFQLRTGSKLSDPSESYASKPVLYVNACTFF